jgi:membrane-associated phospholipid phosphatase
MISKNIAITPDRFFIVLLFASFILERTKSFLRDWTPFIALVLAYELLRGFADTVGFAVHVGDIVNLERSIFGFIPTVALQSHLFNPNHIAWYDIGAAVIDFLHFPLPLIIGFYLWTRSKSAYWKFVIALLTLSFAGFITYLIFPSAPPWYASQRAGLIPVYKIVDYVVSQVGWHWDFSYYYNHLNPNPVAAIPSLHSAYPWLSFLALFNFNKRVGLFFLPYPLLVWFSVVYLGEHYVVDVIAGIAYATLVYLAIYRFAWFSKIFKYSLESVKIRVRPKIKLAVEEVKRR